MNTIYKQIEDKTKYLLDNESQFQFEINNAIYIDYRGILFCPLFVYR